MVQGAGVDWEEAVILSRAFEINGAKQQLYLHRSAAG